MSQFILHQRQRLAEGNPMPSRRDVLKAALAATGGVLMHDQFSGWMDGALSSEVRLARRHRSDQPIALGQKKRAIDF